MNSLTQDQIHDLNWSNKAAQQVQLGTLLDDIVTAINNGGGSGGEDVAKITTLPNKDSFPAIGEPNRFYIDGSTGDVYLYTNGEYKSVGVSETELDDLIQEILSDTVVNGGTI